MVLPSNPPTMLRSVTLEADWGRDGTYSDPLSDISIYMLAVEYRYGLSKPYQEMAQPARMQVVLDNSTGAWSVGKIGALFSGAFKKGALVRLRYTYWDGADYQTATRFIGTLSQVMPDSGELFGKRTATLIVEDPTLRLQDAEYVPPLLTNVTTDTAIKRVFDDAAIVYPYPHRYWMLGVVGASELGSTTTLFDHDITDFTTGISVLPYTGDNADEGRGVSALSFIRDVVAAEMGGRFYWDAPTGKYKFLSRQQYSSARATIDLDSYIVQEPAPEYHYADDLRNQVTISYELKSLKPASQILYSAGNVPFSLSAGQARQFTVRYQDPLEPTARVGGTDMITPVATTDYLANTLANGTGSNLTAFVLLTVEFRANSAIINLINSSNVTMYITLLQLRGTPLVSYGKETIYNQQNDSVFAYGEFPYSMNLPLVESAMAVEDYALLIVNRFGNPISRHERVTIVLSALPFQSLSQAILLIKVGDTVTYYDPLLQLANYVDGEYREPAYMVVGEEGRITGRHKWESTFILEPAVRNVFWLLGVAGRSELDSTTLLAF